MQQVSIRTRNGSVSDMHIQHCDCLHCDGLGELIDQLSHTAMECPACEGLGFLEPASREAYEVYLQDLYQDVVRKMPTAGRTNRHATRHAA